jgi:2-oxoglutarate dehydrogenase E1 component
MLRTQLLRTQRKPLIVMTPKSLLRLPAATSSLDELATGKFHRVLPDETAEPDKVTRVLFCSGKIYYELAEERARRADASVAIVRLEKLYPWWPQLIHGAIEKYGKLDELFWVQDEPANMGAGSFVTPRFLSILSTIKQQKGRDVAFEMISRVESASPATGSHKAHVLEQQQILTAAFSPRKPRSA